MKKYSKKILGVSGGVLFVIILIVSTVVYSNSIATYANIDPYYDDTLNELTIKLTLSNEYGNTVSADGSFSFLITKNYDSKLTNNDLPTSFEDATKAVVRFNQYVDEIENSEKVIDDTISEKIVFSKSDFHTKKNPYGVKIIYYPIVIDKYLSSGDYIIEIQDFVLSNGDNWDDWRESFYIYR